MKNTLLLFLSFSLLYGCATLSQPHRSTFGIPTKPGKCYAKCKQEILKPDQVLKYPIYTGEDSEIKTKSIVLESKQEWVRQKKTENCLSANPEDCLVWCIKEIPTKTIENIVIDTSTTIDYYWYNSPQEELQSHYITDWHEVICQNKFSIKIIENVCMKLNSDNNNNNNNNNEDLDCLYLDTNIRSKFTVRMIKYQKKYYLPIGNFNLETLDHMGITY